MAVANPKRRNYRRKLPTSTTGDHLRSSQTMFVAEYCPAVRRTCTDADAVPLSKVYRVKHGRWTSGFCAIARRRMPAAVAAADNEVAQPTIPVPGRNGAPDAR